MPNIQDTKDASSTSDDPCTLPPGFISIEKILNLPETRLMKEQQNVIGFAQDYLGVKKTNGTDCMCTLKLRDLSTTSNLKLIIFAPEDKLPEVSARDVVLIRSVKVQMWHGEISLLWDRFKTECHILPAANIPKSPSLTNTISWITISLHPKVKGRKPEPVEILYVIRASQLIEHDEALPTKEEFQIKAMQATKIREKFGLLKDVKDGSFHDIIGEVLSIYPAGYNVVDIKLTDYTTNTAFYNYAYPGIAGATTNARDGDEYGYIKKDLPDKEEKEWKGPYGKMTIQVTLYDYHAQAIEDVKLGDFLSLKNVHFAAKPGYNLEGRVRGQPGDYANKVQVEKLDTLTDPDRVDPRLKDCVRRKLDYKVKFEKQKKDLEDEISGGGVKRKAKLNSKERRKEKRAKLEARMAASEQAKSESVELSPIDMPDQNNNIRCNDTNRQAVPLSTILQPTPLSSDPKYDGINLPFTNRKSKAMVRVVDYFPHDIRDFAVGRRFSEYDMLSDYSGEDSGLDESTMDMDSFTAKRKWEWRFALTVEDAHPNGNGERIVLIVGNKDAQMLLNLPDDACDLRANPTILQSVKEQLFRLWGDLEEQKSAIQAQQRRKAAKAKRIRSPSPSDSEDDDDDDDVIRARRKRRSMLPVDSDEDEDADEDEGTSGTGRGRGKDREKNPKKGKGGEEEEEVLKLQPRNKPFVCCIREYGVKEPELDRRLMDAGDGKRWQRVFGLWGTVIM